MPLILIGLGGFAVAIAQYLVDGAVANRTGGSFRWGTLVINATGSFHLGLLVALTAERAILPADILGPLRGRWYETQFLYDTHRRCCRVGRPYADQGAGRDLVGRRAEAPPIAGMKR